MTYTCLVIHFHKHNTKRVIRINDYKCRERTPIRCFSHVAQTQRGPISRKGTCAAGADVTNIAHILSEFRCSRFTLLCCYTSGRPARKLTTEIALIYYKTLTPKHNHPYTFIFTNRVTTGKHSRAQNAARSRDFNIFMALFRRKLPRRGSRPLRESNSLRLRYEDTKTCFAHRSMSVASSIANSIHIKPMQHDYHRYCY